MDAKELEMTEKDWKLMPLFMQFEDVNNILQSHLELSFKMYKNELNNIKAEEEKYNQDIKKLEIENPNFLNDFDPDEEYFYISYKNLKNFYFEQMKLLVNHFAEYFENMWVTTKDTLQKLELYSKKLHESYEYIRNKTEFNEVRLIYNCIKHDNCKVSEELSKAYPKYSLGNNIELDEELLWNLKDITVIACNELRKQLNTYIQALKK